VSIPRGLDCSFVRRNNRFSWRTDGQTDRRINLGGGWVTYRTVPPGKRRIKRAIVLAYFLCSHPPLIPSGIAHGVEMKRRQADWGGCATGDAISHICWWFASSIKLSEWVWWGEVVGDACTQSRFRQNRHWGASPTVWWWSGTKQFGVAVPQAMKSPIAADHHGVPFSLIQV
jgi:hypothetical protein